MRVRALVIRILRQIIRDKRTIALLLFAPILVLTMLHLVFNGEEYVPKIGLVNVPPAMNSQLDFENATIKAYKTLDAAEEDLLNREIDSYIHFINNQPSVVLEGSDPTINGVTMKQIEKALKKLQPTDNDIASLEVEFVHGSAHMGQFDYFGPVLLGFFVFFFVFLIAGVSFLRERTTGTLERLMASPLKKWEIVAGYIIGFGIFTMIQSAIIAAYAIYVLGMLMEGAFIYLLLIILVLALTALSLGILLSSFANNELQMIQFIPIIVVPQIFFSGLFNLETISSWLNWIAPFTPLYYAAEALRDVMVRGYSINEIYIELLALCGFSVMFMLLNIVALRKYRKI
ncbi:ABC transporter permease [Sutcliffiella cohnii]